MKSMIAHQICFINFCLFKALLSLARSMEYSVMKHGIRVASALRVTVVYLVLSTVLTVLRTNVSYVITEVVWGLAVFLCKNTW